MKKEKPIILISGVNLTEGGPLSIMADAVKAFTQYYLHNYKLVLLVNNKSLFPALANNPSVEILEYAYPKKSWFLKLWFEYVHCRSISKKINPDLWFAIHDVTPSVITKNKVVYCHNPAPFYKLTLKEIWNEKTLFFFHFFYSIIYNINIRKNNYVIVQQQWLREESKIRYNVENVIVAYPDLHIPLVYANKNVQRNVYRFCYPALPRSFKNFEVIMQAANALQKKHSSFEIVLTVDGTENSYAAKLVEQYKHINCIKFIGRQTREKTLELYKESDCLIFPSKMETWGLPITEMKCNNKPMLVADERYARETVGDYNKVCFFKTNSAESLATLMEKAISGTLEFEKTNYTIPGQPFAQSWKELFEIILPPGAVVEKEITVLSAAQ